MIVFQETEELDNPAAEVSEEISVFGSISSASSCSYDIYSVCY